MRAVPTFAVSPGIVITKMEQSRNLHVFVVAKGTAEGFTPPEAVDDYPDSEAYAGHGTIFGLFPPGGCQACKFRPPFDGECHDLFSAFIGLSRLSMLAQSRSTSRTRSAPTTFARLRRSLSAESWSYLSRA